MNETRRVPYQQQYLQVMAAACVLQERPHDALTADDQAVGTASAGASGIGSSSSSSSTRDLHAIWPKPFVPTPCNIFCVEKRSEVQAANPNASFDEIGQLLHQRWTNMFQEAQAPYVQQSGMYWICPLVRDVTHLFRSFTSSFSLMHFLPFH